MTDRTVPHIRWPVLWHAADARSAGPAWAATGIALSAAEVRPGDLFVALRSLCGTVDGHASAAAAAARAGDVVLVMGSPEAGISAVVDALDALGAGMTGMDGAPTSPALDAARG